MTSEDHLKVSRIKKQRSFSKFRLFRPTKKSKTPLLSSPDQGSLSNPFQLVRPVLPPSFATLFHRYRSTKKRSSTTNWDDLVSASEVDDLEFNTLVDINSISWDPQIEKKL